MMSHHYHNRYWLILVLMVGGFGVFICPQDLQGQDTSVTTDTAVTSTTPDTDSQSAQNKAETKPTEQDLPTPAKQSTQRTVNGRPFGAGEKIKLGVKYMGMNAGEISITIDKEKLDNQPVYKLEARGQTSGWVEWFYTVDDRFVSYMDRLGLFSWGYDYRQNHEDEKERQSVRYNHDTGRFVQINGDTGPLPEYTQDVISAIYYLRTRPLELGQTYKFPVHLSGEVYTLEILVDDIETIATYDDWREAYVLKPRLTQPEKQKELAEELKDADGVKIWISTDEFRVPLQISVPAKIGSLYGYLTSYKPGKYDSGDKL